MASDAKVAVVTGSSGGIGLATALELARKGMSDPEFFRMMKQNLLGSKG